MKILLTLVLVLALVMPGATAQTHWPLPFPIDSATNEISYHGTVKVPNADKLTLYNRAKSWHAAFAEAVTRTPLKEDAEAGLFIGRRISAVGDKRYVYLVAVECRDGQYEYLFTQIQLLTPYSKSPADRQGRAYLTLPNATPLLKIAHDPANITATGEVRPITQKLLVKANAAFEQLVIDLQQAMAKSVGG